MHSYQLAHPSTHTHTVAVVHPPTHVLLRICTTTHQHTDKLARAHTHPHTHTHTYFDAYALCNPHS